MEVIIIFTKDRVDRLSQSLTISYCLEHFITVIDDSFVPKNMEQNRALCEKNGVHYHGRKEQVELIEKIGSLGVSKFTTDLGKESWSLGFNRNYSFIYSLCIGAEKAIFMVDDILVPDIRIISSIFKNLNFHSHIGVDIELMPDDSVVGHIHRAGYILQPRYISGSFLGVSLKNPIVHYFLNIYNEDWIWLYLENNGFPVFKVGKVDQMRFDPFENGKNRALSQEFGEICWEGVMRLGSEHYTEHLTSDAYWEKIILSRRSTLEDMDQLDFPEKFEDMVSETQSALLDYHNNISSRQFSEIFLEYYYFLNDWLVLQEGIRGNKWEYQDSLKAI